MKFKDLKIGDTFDFISPNHSWNSFFETCKKISPWEYEANGRTHTVGSAYAEVYHVNKEKEDEQSK